MPLGIKLLLGSFFTFLLVAMWVDKRKSWRRVEGTQIVFCQPLARRLLFVGFGFWMMLVPLLLLTGSGADKAPLFVLFLVEPPVCLVGGMLVCAAGLRRELSLDTEQRRYQFTSGWGWHPAVYSGSFSDFGGVFVREPTGRSKSDQYSVGLVWKSGGRTTPLLGMSGKQQEMGALAEEMVALGMPLVPAPEPQTYWELLRRRPTR